MQRLVKIYLTLILCLAPGLLQAQLANSQGSSNIFNNAPLSTSTLQSVLPADSAFNLTAYIETPNTIVLNWQIQDGYYMYRKSLDIVNRDAGNLLLVTAPQGTQIHDEFFGDVEVYYQQLLLRIPYNPAQTGNNITLDLSYQGCAEDRYCYPVQSRSITLEIL